MNMQIASNLLDNVVFQFYMIQYLECERRKNTSSPANNPNLIHLQGHTQKPRAFYFSI